METKLPPAEDVLFVVAEKSLVTRSIVQLRLRPVRQSLAYEPGQYVLLSDAEGRVPQRSFSIANAPRADASISLLVTRVEGGRTSSWAYDRLVVGSTVCLSGPYGTFTQQLPPRRPVLHLAAGSGLAPVLALTEAALRRGVRARIQLVFSARTGADVYAQDLFSAWEARHPNFSFVRTLTRERGAPPLGRIPALLPRLFDDVAGFEIFIAGGGGFVDACERAVFRLGAQRNEVHTEPFFPEPRPWTSALASRVPEQVGPPTPDG